MNLSLKACTQPGREVKDREKTLQLKLAELNSQVQRIERSMVMLRAENDVLRKRQSDQRVMDEKVRILRKRNAILAANCRRLEEQVRALQDRASRNVQKAKSTNNQRPEVSSRRRIQTREASNPHTTHRRAAGSIGHDNLHRKCQKLTDLLHCADAKVPQKGRQFEENQELVHIIKVAAKERLQLEHELAHSRMKIGGHAVEPGPECVTVSLDASLTSHSPQCQQKLARLFTENQQLHHSISCLRVHVEGLTKNQEECTTLKLSLAVAQKEKEEAEKEAKYLGRRVHSLENVVRDLQESAEHVGQLENQRKTALQQLQQKQAQLQQLQEKQAQLEQHQVTSGTESTHTQELSRLIQQLAQAEEKLRLEEETRLKLIQEVQRLQKEAEERERIAAELELAKEKLARMDHKVITPPGEEEITEISLLEVSRTSWNHHDNHTDDSLMSLWARNGPIQVYIAKYNYDPFQLSPNENPEAELALTAGDYILVAGDMDEDGFFDGELIDGSQGLVPSNFIEKVKDEDLCLFHEVLLHAGHWNHRLTTDSDPSNNKTVHTLTAESSPVTQSRISDHAHVSRKSDTQTIDNREYSHSNKVADDVEDENGNSQSMSDLLIKGDNFDDSPPCPRNLWLDQQLPDSAHLRWTAPEPSPGLQLHCYHVLVDGETKAVVRGSDRTEVTLEGINASSTCQVCVRCLSNRGQSRDAQCTMLVGKGKKDPVVDTEAMLQSPPLRRQVSEERVSTQQPVFRSVGSMDGEEQKGVETDEEIEEAFRQTEDLNEAVDRLSESSYTNSSRTELSDIPEVEEDLLGSQDSQLNKAGATQVASRSPEWAIDRSAPSRTDEQPREFHSEKPSQFDGKPLAAPTPRTPTIIAMQNHVTQQVVPASVDEGNLPSSHSTPTDVCREQTGSPCEQPAGDIHISRAFLTMDQTQQKNFLNQLHLLSVGDKVGDLQNSHHTHKTPAGFSVPAKLFSDNFRQDIVVETLTDKLIESDIQPGNHVAKLPTSAFRVLESSDDSEEVSGDISPVVKANSVRLFIALYDYHPATMSPNKDSIDEELSFREGQILKVFGHKDADGFFKGESNGIMGYIPCNMVCEVQVDDPKLRQQLLQDISEIPREPHIDQPSSDAPVVTNGRSSSVETKKSLGKKMIAMYDYDPHEVSPNMDAELELSLTAGDIVTIFGDMDEDGFFTGEVNNRFGLVPSNFLQPLPSINYRHST